MLQQYVLLFINLTLSCYTLSLTAFTKKHYFKNFTIAIMYSEYELQMDVYKI